MASDEVVSAERAQRLRERAERERRARIAAEEILEQKSRELFQLNQQLERLVAERARALNLTLENISQGILMLGSDGYPHVQNRRAAELLELSEAQSVEAAVASLLSLHTANADGRFETTRPSGRVLEVCIAPLGDGGTVLTLTDISDVKSREAELRAASAVAQAASEAKSRFLSTMSHEMRTPLNGVIGSLDLLSELTLTRDQKFYVDTALKASEALLVQISDVLDFSKLDAGKLEMASAPLSLERLIGEVAQILRPQATRQGNVIAVRVAPAVPEFVLGDEGRLRQVLLNLVGNAVKFTVDGSITISAECVGAVGDRPQIEVCVIDSGAGIPDDKIGLLFQEFAMLDTSFSRKVEGTGLGLAIAKRLIGAMGGTIGVTSRVGEGSRFWFRITAAVATNSVSAGAAAAPMPNQMAPLRVLLVDDNGTNRLIGSRMLEAAGHRVETATDGFSAVEKVAQGSFDVVLMDISMPGMDGIEATGRIKGLAGVRRPLPIIALTANALAGDRERFLAAGMADYLTKPLRRAELEAALARVTRASQPVALAS